LKKSEASKKTISYTVFLPINLQFWESWSYPA
jgi:hypothetical protein